MEEKEMNICDSRIPENSYFYIWDRTLTPEEKEWVSKATDEEIMLIYGDHPDKAKEQL